MEDYEDNEPDLQEQIFHNNVREQIVSIWYRKQLLILLVLVLSDK